MNTYGKFKVWHGLGVYIMEAKYRHWHDAPRLWGYWHDELWRYNKFPASSNIDNRVLLPKKAITIVAAWLAMNGELQ